MAPLFLGLKCFCGVAVCFVFVALCFFFFSFGGDSEFEGLTFVCFDLLLSEYLLFCGGDSEFGLVCFAFLLLGLRA